MGRRRVLCIIGILLAVIGIISFTLSIFRQGENQRLLFWGMMCNSISLILYTVNRRKG